MKKFNIYWSKVIQKEVEKYNKEIEERLLDLRKIEKRKEKIKNLWEM